MTNRADSGGQRPSWRGSDEDPPRGPAASPNSWRSTARPRSSSPLAALGSTRSKKLARAVAAAGSLLLSGALIVLLWVMPGCTRTELIVASVDAYQDCQIPTPVFAQHDTAALEEAGSRLVGTVTAGIQTSDEFTKRLQAIDDRSVAVIYLSAQGGYLAAGGAGREQSAAFFWKDSRADEPHHKTSEPRQFYTLQRFCGDLKALPAKQHKLLLLDLGSTRPDWRTGRLGNWFNDALDEPVRGIPNLTVISSCSPGELSWGGGNLGDDPQGRSAFAHFVATGLQGAADANHNRRLTFRELFNYVHDNTNAWVWQNRDPAGQHPFASPSDTQFDKTVYIALSSKSTARKSSSAATDQPAANTKSSASLKSVWTDLDAAWKDREALGGDSQDVYRTTAAYQFDPLSWRAITHDLLHAEQFRRERAAKQAEPLVRRARLLLDQLKQTVASDILNSFNAQPFISQHVIRRLRSETLATARQAAVELPEDHFADAAKELLPQFAAAGKRGIELRRLAESIACGPLGTRQIGNKSIARGDQLRRSAEDRLFVHAELDQIQQNQQEATRVYQQALAVQQAYDRLRNLRNRLLAELPELAVWAAFRAPQVRSAHQTTIVRLFQTALTDASARPSTAQLRQLTADTTDLDSLNIELLILFQLNRDFERKLKDWPALDKITETAINETQTQFDEATRSLQRIEQTIRTRTESLVKSQRQPQVPNWRDVAELLAFPELPAAQRVILNAVLGEYSRKLEEGIKVADIAKAPPEPAADLRAAHARWHALWAIQVLGRGPDSANDQDELWGLWNRLPSDDHPEFKRQITDLGDRLRKALIWSRDRLEEESLRNEQPEAGSDPSSLIDAALNQRAIADRIARNYVDHCAAAEFAGKLNPAADWRRYQAEFLFVALAEQYLDDYWNGWYDVAVAECLKAAGSVGLEVFQGRWQQLQTLLQKRQAAYPDIVGNTVIFGSTDVKVLPLTITNHGLPSGEAALWLDVPRQRGLILNDNVVRSVPLTDTAAASDNQRTINFRLERDGTTDGSPDLIEARPRIFFRGHRWEDRIKTVRINPARPVGVQFAYQAPPSTGKVVVEGYQKPVILFILDCSLSMNTNVAGGGTRFSVASSVFESTLANLALQTGNNACHVGLLAYGGGLEGVELLSNIDLLNPEHQQRIINAWKKLKPEGSTPLFRSISRACDELAKNNTAGTIVAITDGIDGEPDPQKTVYDSLKKRLNRAQGTGVELIMIGFELKAEQLTVAEKEKYTQMKELSNRFLPAQGKRGLDEALRESVRIRPYSIFPLAPRNRGLKPIENIPFGADRELDLGNYQARFAKAKPLEFQITGGEFIKLQADRFQVTHPKPSNIRGSEPNPSALQELRFGYRSFKIDSKRSTADFILSLTHDDETASVPRPAEIDITINPTDDTGLRSLEWTIEPGQTVPTWHVTVQNWPGNKSAEIQASWKVKRTPHDLASPWKEVRAPRQFVLNSSADEKLTLKVLGTRFNPQSSTARLELQIADFDPQNPSASAPVWLEELRKTRLELQERGSTVSPVDRSTRRELIAEEGKLIIEIEVPGVATLDDWELLVTSSQSLKMGAIQLKTPLTILKTDQEL